jgi:hypothetical protein
LKEGQLHQPQTLAYVDVAATNIDISKFPFIAEAAFIKLKAIIFGDPAASIITKRQTGNSYYNMKKRYYSYQSL